MTKWHILGLHILPPSEINHTAKKNHMHENCLEAEATNPKQTQNGDQVLTIQNRLL